MAEKKLKSVKMSDDVHAEMKIFAVQGKIKNLTWLIDNAVKEYIKKLKK